MGAMGNTHKKLLKPLLKWVLPAILVAAIGLVLYCIHLSTQIEARFSGRRWDVPSTLYSDTTLCYPGQRINRSRFRDKLTNLGYREVPDTPDQKGERHTEDSRLMIFLHDLKTPSQYRPGFPVIIHLDKDRITSIKNTESGDPVPILELEPEQLMSFFGDEREQRRIVSFDELPPHLVHAVLAAEDVRFYRHEGMDLRAILRALYTNLRYGDIRQGGSTITQQLAKNYFLTSQRTLSRKLKELLIALTMEVMYQKDEILEIYLNEIYLGQKGSVSVNGVGEASRFYFGKPVSQLTLNEAAVIAGLIKSPNVYSPFVDKERARHRRNTVLQRMHREGWISDEAFDTTRVLPVKTIDFAAYGKKAPYFMDYLSAQLKNHYPSKVLIREGLTIYTTLDTQVQSAAEYALSLGLARLENADPRLKRDEPRKCLQGAIVVMQPRTGYVLAMVGGRDYALSQFNRITQAERQPGSAFKPFVFLAGLDKFTPASLLSNEPKTYKVTDGTWTPENYAPIPDSHVTMRTALAKSINRATVDLAMQVGIQDIVQTARTLGFSLSTKPYPSVSLGAAEVIPMELARAYCPFAAQGVLPYPLLFKAVADEDGTVLEQRHMDIDQAISPEKAFIMTSMLKSVVAEGTAQSLHNLGIHFPVAGKTGTTNAFRDAWFVGYTPDILALVWVGFDQGTPIFGTGASAALPIWADLMKAIPQHVSNDWFQRPAGVVRLTICLESGQIAIPSRCPQQKEEVFLVENAPQKPCPIHRPKGVLERFWQKFKDVF